MYWSLATPACLVVISPPDLLSLTKYRISGLLRAKLQERGYDDDLKDFAKGGFGLDYAANAAMLQWTRQKVEEAKVKEKWVAGSSQARTGGGGGEEQRQ